MPKSLHYFKPGQDVTCVATTDLAGAEFVKIVPGGSYNVPHVAKCGADEVAFGVSIDAVAADEHVLVHTGGIVPVVAGGSLTAGARVYADSDGKATSAGTTNPAGQVIADAVSGDLASVHLSI